MGLPEAVTARHLEEQIRRHVRYTLAREWEQLEPAQILDAVALAVRDYLVEAALETERRWNATGAKRVYYLSIEYMIGRSLSNNLRNLGLFELCQTTLSRLGVDLNDVLEREPDAALGNGGLGRLAACFLDSMATMGYAGMGYGINYEHGLFRQAFIDGQQVERPENWRLFGTPWLISRPEEAVAVPLYGKVVHGSTVGGQYNPVWNGWRLVLGVPADMPIVGYGGRTVTFLRLYSALSPQDYDMGVFQHGDYLKAVERKIADETISKVLYPSDSAESGRELRLRQEYFFVACAIRDIVRKFEATGRPLSELPDRVAIQLNDTHPALAIAEMMRLLVDDRGVAWCDAWDITQKVFGFTNHTLMPEALETWSTSLLESVVPRHLLIIYEINRRFIEHVRTLWPGDTERMRRVSLLTPDAPTKIRMAHLAIVGSHSVNGVSRLHSELVKRELVPDFAELFPERFNNKTNGVTPRRWILCANPKLAALLTSAIGVEWVRDFERVRGIEPLADDAEFRAKFAAVKLANKARLATIIKDQCGVNADAGSLFDVHIKRIHEYKRQLLNALRIAHDYLRIVEDGQIPAVPRTYIFAGKAALGYDAAKQIIRVILAMAAHINRDRKASRHMRVAFLPDYRVTLAEQIIPAADLSEQISTAGMEASGTGNMKLAMNGALMICTRDGANLEIADAVGREHVFEFGLTVDEVHRRKWEGLHHPHELLDTDDQLRRVMKSFETALWSPKDPGLSQWVWDRLVNRGDEFMLLADFRDYVEAQDRAAGRYSDADAWNRSAILNVARMGPFSSDRSIREYAEDIWQAAPTL
jgi:starch phosphorylase